MTATEIAAECRAEAQRLEAEAKRLRQIVKLLTKTTNKEDHNGGD